MFLHIVALVATAILLPVVLHWFLNSDVNDLQRRAMREQAEALAQHLAAAPNGGWSFALPEGMRDQFSEAYGRYAYVVLDDAGAVLFASRKDRLPIFPVGERDPDVEFLEARRGDQIIFGVSLRKVVEGRPVRFQVAEDLAHRDVLIDDVVATFFQNVAWVTIPVLLLLLVIDIVIVRRAVRPLLRASDRAQHISPTRTDVRLPTNDIPREIFPLVTAINQALDRLERGFKRQQEFTADAAHELRTPLAVLRTRIETLPDRQSAAALLRNIEIMSRVIAQLLDAAEVETLTVNAEEEADLRAVCAEVAEFIAPLALRQGKSVELTGVEGPVWVKGNPEMLRRAIRNVVENAVKYSPEHTEVEIAVDHSGTVSVLDRGEGISDANRELIFGRFWRRDSRTGGAGLGLSIVKRIVDAHGGTIAVRNRPNGGAEFCMRFPLSRQRAPASAA